jgi:hypothetical protein
VRPRLFDVLLEELDGEELDHLADLLAPRIAVRIERAAPAADVWIDSIGAASYLGISKNALHKLTAARAIPFGQDGPGCKCWFQRSDLDAYRRGQDTYAAKTQPRTAFRRLRAVSGQ